MPKIEVDDETHAKLKFAAESLGLEIHELIKIMRPPLVAPPPAPVVGSSGKVPIHCKYLGHRFDGTFDSSTEEVTIHTGALAGKTLSSPTAAANVVVASINPGRAHPSTNGRKFWQVTATGATLGSIM